MWKLIQMTDLSIWLYIALVQCLNTRRLPGLAMFRQTRQSAERMGKGVAQEGGSARRV